MGKKNTWKGLVRESYEKIVFIVAQQHVIFRPSFFYEARFFNERLDIICGRVPGEAFRFAKEGAFCRRKSGGRRKIGSQAAAKIRCFADVEYVAARVFEEIDARERRCAPHPFPKVPGGLRKRSSLLFLRGS